MLTRKTAFLLAIIGALAFLGGRASAQITRIDLDLSWWHAVDTTARPDVVAGMVTAFEEGWISGSDAEGERLVDAAPANVRQLIYNLVYEKNSAGDYVSLLAQPVFSKSFGFYEAGIDDYYLRFPQKSSVHVGYVIGCLADTAAWPNCESSQ